MDGKTVSRSNVIGKIEVGDDSVLNLTQQLVVSHEPASTLVPAELPAPAEMFDRKEESKQFESHVNSGCHLLYIGGMPGVGKTTCLAKWANMVKSEYPDGQLYLDASKFVSAGVTVSCELQKTVLRSFGVSGINAMNEQETERAYRSWTSEKRLLIAVDNVIDDSVIRALKPNSANALMIVAGCRNPNRRSLDEIILKLECFHPRDAKGYLEERVRLLADPADADAVINCLREDERSLNAIIAKCDGLALALDGAAHLLSDGLHTPKDVASAVSGSAEDGVLSELLSASLENFSEASKALYHFFGSIEGHTVWMPALKYSSSIAGHCDSLIELLASWLLVKESRSKAYGTKDLDDVTVRMHASIAAHAKKYDCPDAASYYSIARNIVRYYRALVQKMDNVLTHERLRICPQIEFVPDGLQEIDACEAQELFFERHREFEAVIEVSIREGFYEDALACAEALWVFYYENRMYGQGLGVFENGLSAAFVLEDDDAAARMLSLVSRLHLLLGEKGVAVQEIQRALALSENSTNNTLRGSVREFAGSAYGALGQNDKAIELYEEAKREYRKEGSRFTRGCAIADVLSVRLCLEAGDIGTACTLVANFEEYLAVVVDSATRAKLYVARAMLLESLGEIGPALDDLLRAEAECGDANLRRRRADIREKLGDISLSCNKKEEAINFFESARVDWEALNSGNHVDRLSKKILDIGRLD